VTAKASSRNARNDADRITRAVDTAHEIQEQTRRKNAGYIPALAEVDPQLLGICVATVEGRRSTNPSWAI
jgi:glutaminase